MVVLHQGVITKIQVDHRFQLLFGRSASESSELTPCSSATAPSVRPWAKSEVEPIVAPIVGLYSQIEATVEAGKVKQVLIVKKFRNPTQRC